MNAKLKLMSILTFACLIVSSLFTIQPLGIQPVSAASQATYGGFLFPWSGTKHLIQNLHPAGANAIDVTTSATTYQEFDVLAPKDGVVIDYEDRFPRTQNVGCVFDLNASFKDFPNYVLLGHGYLGDDTYQSYTLYYHLKQGSVSGAGISRTMFVRLGQKIGVAGDTGEWNNVIHLHFEMSKTPQKSRLRNLNCNGVNLSNTYYYYFVPTDSISIGFEENGNNWPLLNGGKGNLTSFNWTGIQPNDCNPLNVSTKVALYNHIDYGGECVTVPSPDNGFNVPASLHISAIYLNSTWLQDSSHSYRTLTLWDGYNHSGNQTVIGASEPRLADLRAGDWNDRVKSVHNALHNNAPWLLEESYAFQAPFNVNLHIRVASDPDFNAWRVCFDGQNCQENAAPINELYYTWNTYGWADGNHIISIQYRRTSDNNDWNNADYYETNYYLNPIRQTFAPCGTNLDGARLVSGGDCIIVTDDVRDLAPVGWADRSDTYVSVTGPYEAWVYDSVDYLGAARVVRSGQNVYVGGNTSSVDLKPLSAVPPPNPTGPFLADANTIHLWHIDDWTGSIIHDSVGSLHGNKVDQVAWITNDLGNVFDKALLFPNPPDGRGITFSPMENICPFTWEGWVGVPSESNGGRIAGQLAGGGNTGVNKWLISIDGKRPRVEVWSGGGSQIAYGYKEVNSGWNYLMFTYDCENSVKLYLNNELVGETTTAAVWSSVPTTYEIGSAEGIGRFYGAIDEVRISNTVRVPTHQSVPPTATFPPPPSNTPSPTPINTPTATPTLAPCPTITAWKGEYWNNDSLTGPANLCRNDAEINFHWDAGSPNPVISDDHFSVRWTRDINFSAGQYRFEIFHDDGARIYIDGDMIFEDWCSGCREIDNVSHTMTAGIHRVVMEMYDNEGWATAQLTWQQNQPPTPTPTYTPTPGLMNTGLLGPSSNSAQTGGDNNGYEVNSTNAYGNDSVYSVDNNSGTNTDTTCTNTGKDKHVYRNYNINLPGTATIQGIELRLDAKADSTSGSPKVCVQLSWDGGISWTTAKSTSTLGTSEQTFILGSATDKWGRTWSASQLSNTNFRVRIIDVSSSTSRDFSLDWVAVRVTYQ